MGKKVEVSAKLSDGDRVATVNYTFGDNLEESGKLFGVDCVWSKFVQAAIIDLQSLMRRLVKAGKSDEEIAATVKGWKPGVKTTIQRTPQEKAVASLDALSDTERAAIIKQYQKK